VGYFERLRRVSFLLPTLLSCECVPKGQGRWTFWQSFRRNVRATPRRRRTQIEPYAFEQPALGSCIPPLISTGPAPGRGCSRTALADEDESRTFEGAKHPPRG